MRQLCLLFVCLLTIKLSISQSIIKYYNRNWNPTEAKYAAFFSVLEMKENIWNKTNFYSSTRQVQMYGQYEDTSENKPVGKFYFFYPNEKLKYTGEYVNYKKHGAWLRYYSDGMPQDSFHFDNGKTVGISLSWHRNGFIRDSLNRVNDSLVVCVSWFDNGVLSEAGRYLNDKKNGTWVYYNREGFKTAIEKYDNGKLLVKNYFNVDGIEENAMNIKDEQPKFRSGMEDWVAYLGDKLFSPSHVKLVNTDKIVVVVRFDVNEMGKLVNAEVTVPFHPEYDLIALDVIKKSPNWKPAIFKNRAVMYSYEQPVTFREED